ncbi:TatD family hydrolase [Tautonia plasticadhaerens]|uniref:Putative deoxyribonuclease YcfH n=1 Tax=Tautonia plasticadhaerens TaxID=2527974 RepID=A0A518HB43_9BACT|nr:TatD family hydrolase [Tautonia plasticadhaerens]QDV38059.1 putative deoxyribonuclease YcfH [Tautonia plasticadhaerens]
MAEPRPPTPRLSPLVDTHAHLDDPRLLDQLDAALDRARAAGVEQVVAIATTADSADAVIGIASARPGVFAAVGIQPNHVAEAGPEDWGRVVDRVRAPKVVAVGETGLDRYWDDTPFPQQQDSFDRHLALAAEHDLPVVIHCRECESDVVAQLERLGRPVPGILHSFTGTWDDAQAFLALGLHLSFAGMVTFRNPSLDPLREVATRMPADRLLVETDSPYLSPHPFRGKTNEPARVAVTCSRIAELRGMEAAELARISTENARRLFRLGGSDVL